MIVSSFKDKQDFIYFTLAKEPNIIAKNLQTSTQKEDHDYWTKQIRDFTNNLIENQQDDQDKKMQITRPKIMKLVREQRIFKEPGEEVIQIKHIKKLPRKVIVQFCYIYKVGIYKVAL